MNNKKEEVLYVQWYADFNVSILKIFHFTQAEIIQVFFFQI